MSVCIGYGMGEGVLAMKGGHGPTKIKTAYQLRTCNYFKCVCVHAWGRGVGTQKKGGGDSLAKNGTIQDYSAHWHEQ